MKTILIPSDFSSNAVSALRYAIHLSRQLNAKLVVYHCSHMTGLAMPSAAPQPVIDNMIMEDEENKQAQLEQQVKETYSSLGIAKIPATTKIVVEFNAMVVEAIIEFAQKENADIIVTGTHGASGLKKLLLGSNTSSLVSKSPVPVLAIPEGYTGQSLKSICFCSDLENIKEELRQLTALIGSLHAKIEILHFDYGKDPQQQLIKKAEELVNNPANQNIKLVIQNGTIEISLVEQIKNYLSTHRPDCMLMFTHERNFWDKLFIGSKTEDMATSLTIPLLSLKSGEAAPVVSY